MQEEDKLDDAEARIIIPRDPVVEKKRIVTGRFNPGVADRLQEAFEQQLTLPNVWSINSCIQSFNEINSLLHLIRCVHQVHARLGAIVSKTSEYWHCNWESKFDCTFGAHVVWVGVFISMIDL